VRPLALAGRSALTLALLASAPGRVRAEPAPALSDEEILGTSTAALHVESVTTRVTAFDQFGHGYQSQAGPSVSGPGSERLTVFEPQVEIVATQGDRLTHRIWVPVDVISNASPGSIAPPDVVSGASRHVESGTIDWTTTYRASPVFDASMRGGIHLENPFRSWYAGLGGARSLAERNTVLGGSVLAIFDWFDAFDIHGGRHGRTQRTTTTGSVSFTQVLSPTTVATFNYGLTVQHGELGNTWNSVPLEDGTRGPELLPDERVRHALVARAAQFLPWNGALRLYYRFYADDWGIVAHSVEGLLNQRIAPAVYVGVLYRFHTQTGPTFFTTDAPLDATLRVADSDLAPLQSQTIGGKIVGDVPLASGPFRSLHAEVEYDRYVRTNDLTVDIVSCALGWRY
jgi:Protein of unknown function (DUF3570)